MFATQQEIEERFRAETFEHAPADAGDTRFEFFETLNEDTPYGTHLVDDQGVAYETHFFATSLERSELVASFRYAQAVPFEEEFAPFGPAWQREQAERYGMVV